MEKLFVSGPRAGQVGDFTLINFAGFGISANLEFYDSTLNPAYLLEAQRIANRSLTRYFNGAGAINDEGFWSFELVHALTDLYGHDKNPLWLNRLDTAMERLHNDRRDPNGHYGTLWGRGPFQGGTPLSSWNLNDQAAVAASFLNVAAVPEPATWVLALAACLLLGIRRIIGVAAKLSG